MQWFLKVQGIYASCLCLSTSLCYWGYRSQTGGRGETISAYKDNWLRITSGVSHSYQLQWHTRWLGWDWINGCTLREVFPLPSALVGERKCMCRINSTSNSGLTLTLTNTHVCSNQAFYGTMLTLCDDAFWCFLFYFSWNLIQVTPRTTDFINHRVAT